MFDMFLRKMRVERANQRQDALLGEKYLNMEKAQNVRMDKLKFLYEVERSKQLDYEELYSFKQRSRTDTTTSGTATRSNNSTQHGNTRKNYHGYVSEPGTQYTYVNRNKKKKIDLFQRSKMINANDKREAELAEAKQRKKCRDLLRKERKHERKALEAAVPFIEKTWIHDLLATPEPMDHETIEEEVAKVPETKQTYNLLTQVDHSDDEVEIDYEKERIKRINKIPDPFVRTVFKYGDNSSETELRQMLRTRDQPKIIRYTPERYGLESGYINERRKMDKKKPPLTRESSVASRASDRETPVSLPPPDTLWRINETDSKIGKTNKDGKVFVPDLGHQLTIARRSRHVRRPDAEHEKELDLHEILNE